VVQQASTVRTHSDLQVADYMSEEMTSWPEEMWNRKITGNQVWFKHVRWIHSYNCWTSWWGVIVQSV